MLCYWIICPKKAFHAIFEYGAALVIIIIIKLSSALRYVPLSCFILRSMQVHPMTSLKIPVSVHLPAASYGRPSIPWNWDDYRPRLKIDNIGRRRSHCLRRVRSDDEWNPLVQNKITEIALLPPCIHLAAVDLASTMNNTSLKSNESLWSRSQSIE